MHVGGVVPARKIGKHWRFLEADLYQVGIWNRESCSTNAPVRFGGFASASVASKLDAALARRTSTQPKSSSASSVRTPGDRPDSASSAEAGTKPLNDG